MRRSDSTTSTPAPHAPDIPAKSESPEMFDRIARRYDLLNHLLSGGTDILWRRRVAKLVGERPHRVLLDLACGTGDQLLEAVRRNPGVERAIGIDPSAGMLEIGQRKVDAQGLGDRVTMWLGDGQRLPLDDTSIDCATIAFGIRNVPDPERGLREFVRVLRPGGSALVLEFSLPTNSLLRGAYLFYFRHVLPRLGALVSGDATAYRYLNRTVEAFPCGEDFARLALGAGFGGVQVIPLSGGIATIYVCQKDDDDL